MSPILRVLIACLLLPIRFSLATEWRQITMNDGRVLTAQVLESEGTIMMVRTPLGRVRVDLLEVRKIENITEADYESLEPLRVILLPYRATQSGQATAAEALESLTYEHLVQLDGLEVILAKDFAARLGKETTKSLLACGNSLICSMELLAPTGIDWIIHGEVGGNASQLSIELAAVRSTAPDTKDVQDFSHEGHQGLAHELGVHILHLFGIDEPNQAFQVQDPSPNDIVPPSTQAGEEAHLASGGPVPPGRKFLARSAFIPVPGLPSLLKRDLRSFGLSWGVVVPTTVGMVALVGQSSFRSSQFNALSMLSYYALTVGVNRRFGLEESKATARFSTPPRSQVGRSQN